MHVYLCMDCVIGSLGPRPIFLRENMAIYIAKSSLGKVRNSTCIRHNHMLLYKLLAMNNEYSNVIHCLS